MHILMILENDFPPDVRVEKEIKSLVKAGFQVTLVCSSPKSDNTVTDWNGAKIIKFKMPKIIYKSSVASLKFPIYFNYWLNILNKVFRKNKFDAIHLHDLPLAQAVHSFSQKLHIPFVLDLHENWAAAMDIATHTNTFLGKMLSSTKQWYEYERTMIPRADRIITVIDEMKERINNYDVDYENVIVLPNTPLLSEQKEINSNSHHNEKFTLFYAGGINIHRGLQIVLKAIKILKNSGIYVEFQIAGEGSYKKNLVEYIKINQIDNCVRFLGWLDYNDMMENLAKADVAIIPHLRSEQTDNSSPNKLYQYGFLEKAVIASDCKSLKRLLTEAKSGVLYHYDDPEDLAEKIRYLIDNPDQRIEMGRAGKKVVINQHNWELNSKQLINLYQAVLS